MKIGCPYCSYDFQKQYEKCLITSQPTNGAIKCDFDYELCESYNAQTIGGYWFVLVEYQSGRYSLSARRYQTEKEAKQRAAQKRKLPNVKSVRICYQPSLADVDIKNFI